MSSTASQKSRRTVSKVGHLPSYYIYIDLKLITKNFLYTCKLNEETPTFENLMKNIKYKIKMENNYSSKSLFDKKWKKEIRDILN
jgi:hypothetical protein